MQDNAYQIGSGNKFGNKKESLFNEALAKIMRLHAIRSSAHEARMSSSWLEYMNSLNSFRIELNERFNIDEEKYADLKEEEINKIVTEWRYSSNSWQKVSLDYNQYVVLSRYEMWLCKKAHKQGLSMPDMPSGSDALG